MEKSLLVFKKMIVPAVSGLPRSLAQLYFQRASATWCFLKPITVITEKGKTLGRLERNFHGVGGE